MGCQVTPELVILTVPFTAEMVALVDEEAVLASLTREELARLTLPVSLVMDVLPLLNKLESVRFTSLPARTLVLPPSLVETSCAR